MISSSFDENPNENHLFLLKEIAICRKLGRGASCVGAAIAIYVNESRDLIHLNKRF